ncbi:YlxR family protein [Leptolyngbya boryana FACHB-1624]
MRSLKLRSHPVLFFMLPNYRRCICCRKVAPKAEFLRIVRLHPSHEIAINTGMGRSAYLCPTADCLKAVQKKDRLSRVLKAPVPPEIYQTLQPSLQPKTKI